MRSKTTVVSCLGAAAAAALVSFAADAEAQVIIKRPNEHPDYVAELEPHATFGLWHRGYGYRGRYGRGGYSVSPFSEPELGAGFRATIKIVDPGFIPKLNNVVGITFGLNITNCQFCYRDDWSLYTPVGLQWRFWITKEFSAFADLGFVLRTEGFYREVYPDFFAMLGGSYHFNDDVAFTFRIGIPWVTLGVSFFVG
jgi:hypothetical protein